MLFRSVSQSRYQADALKAEAGENKEETQTIIDKRIWEVKQEMFKGWKGFIDTAGGEVKFSDAT